MTKVEYLEDVSPAVKTATERLAALITDCENQKIETQRLGALRGVEPDQDSRIEMIACGDDVPEVEDVDLAYKKSLTRYWDLHAACEYQTKKIRAVRYDAAKTYCASLKAPHDAILQRLGKALVEAHAAHVEYNQLRNDLLDHNVPYIGICAPNPHVALGPANDKSSALAFLFRELVEVQAISKMPVFA